jgi:hypothetical protein
VTVAPATTPTTPTTRSTTTTGPAVGSPLWGWQQFMKGK